VAPASVNAMREPVSVRWPRFRLSSGALHESNRYLQRV